VDRPRDCRGSHTGGGPVGTRQPPTPVPRARATRRQSQPGHPPPPHSHARWAPRVVTSLYPPPLGNRGRFIGSRQTLPVVFAKWLPRRLAAPFFHPAYGMRFWITRTSPLVPLCQQGVDPYLQPNQIQTNIYVEGNPARSTEVELNTYLLSRGARLYRLFLLDRPHTPFQEACSRRSR